MKGKRARGYTERKKLTAKAYESVLRISAPFWYRWRSYGAHSVTQTRTSVRIYSSTPFRVLLSALDCQKNHEGDLGSIPTEYLLLTVSTLLRACELVASYYSS